jgi:hypothetical protein
MVRTRIKRQALPTSMALAWCQLKSISCAITGNSTASGFVVTINDTQVFKQVQKRLKKK